VKDNVCARHECGKDKRGRTSTLRAVYRHNIFGEHKFGGVICPHMPDGKCHRSWLIDEISNIKLLEIGSAYLSTLSEDLKYN
jgi:hypothetical protein